MEEKELEKKAPGEAEAENIPENGAGVENTAENAAGPAGASADGEDAPENGKEEKKEKKGLFGKKKDLRDTQIEELTDQLKRSMAEFDNYRKRTDLRPDFHNYTVCYRGGLSGFPKRLAGGY